MLTVAQINIPQTVLGKHDKIIQNIEIKEQCGIKNLEARKKTMAQ